MLRVIEYMKRYCGFNGDSVVRRALNDLALEKTYRLLKEADQCNQLAAQKRREYIDLMRPYDGMKLVDIPLPVINKADKLMKDAKKYDNQWNKLMNFVDKMGESDAEQ